jgi:hypothetical protein
MADYGPGRMRLGLHVLCDAGHGGEFEFAVQVVQLNVLQWRGSGKLNYPYS